MVAHIYRFREFEIIDDFDELEFDDGGIDEAGPLGRLIVFLQKGTCRLPASSENFRWQ